jgi:RNA-directed DNA polymerase
MRLFKASDVSIDHKFPKFKAAANPFERHWEEYIKMLTFKRMLKSFKWQSVKSKVFKKQKGICPGCHQGIDEEVEYHIHHIDGNHSNNQISNLVMLHPNCHRQVHYAPPIKESMKKAVDAKGTSGYETRNIKGKQ